MDCFASLAMTVLVTVTVIASEERAKQSRKNEQQINH